MQLTNSQQVAYDALLRGENVFLTGGAGSYMLLFPDAKAFKVSGSKGRS